jgi:hypothetical protein
VPGREVPGAPTGGGALGYPRGHARASRSGRHAFDGDRGQRHRAHPAHGPRRRPHRSVLGAALPLPRHEDADPRRGHRLLHRRAHGGARPRRAPERAARRSTRTGRLHHVCFRAQPEDVEAVARFLGGEPESAVHPPRTLRRAGTTPSFEDPDGILEVNWCRQGHFGSGRLGRRTGPTDRFGPTASARARPCPVRPIALGPRRPAASSLSPSDTSGRRTRAARCRAHGARVRRRPRERAAARLP